MKMTSFRDDTRKMLINRPASLGIATISKKLDISVSWLNAFAKGAIENPGVVTIETLNVFLKNFLEKADKDSCKC